MPADAPPTGRSFPEKHAWLKAALPWLLSVMLTACASSPRKPPSPAARANAALQFRIATYNVFTGLRNVPKTVAAIRQLNADVVALQEIAPRGAVLLDRALARDYPYRHFSNGLALLSRFPLRPPRFLRSQRGINGFLFAEIDHPRGRWQIANLHLDPLRLWSAKDRWMLPAQLLWGQGAIHRSELRQVQENLRADRPTILLGDFNSANPAAPNRLRALGFIDSYASVTRHPNRTPTLHFSALGFSTGRRIDFIFHTRDFATVASKVLPGAPSDHDPVASTLLWNKNSSERRVPSAGTIQ